MPFSNQCRSSPCVLGYGVCGMCCGITILDAWYRFARPSLLAITTYLQGSKNNGRPDAAACLFKEFVFFDHLYKGGTQYRTAALLRIAGDPSRGCAAIRQVWSNTSIGYSRYGANVATSLSKLIMLAQEYQSRFVRSSVLPGDRAKSKQIDQHMLESCALVL